MCFEVTLAHTQGFEVEQMKRNSFNSPFELLAVGKASALLTNTFIQISSLFASSRVHIRVYTFDFVTLKPFS